MIKLRKKKLKDNTQSLYLDIYVNGVRSYEFLNMYLGKDKEHNKNILGLANAIKAKKEIELHSNEHGFIPSSKKKTQLIEYFEIIRKKRKNPTKGSFISMGAHLKRFKKSNIRLYAIDENWISEFEKYLKSKVNDYTTLTYLNNLKALLNCAIRDRLIQTNPFFYYKKLKKPDVKKEYLTIDELTILGKTESDRPEIKRAFLFSCFSGLRLSDVTNLKWENVSGDKLDFRQEKTSAYEYLPLSKTAVELIFCNGKNVYGLPDDNVFQVPSQQAVSRALKRWSKRAGIKKKITFHTGRHTFATVGLTQGIDIYTVSKLLGHTDVKNTQIYAKIIDEKKREAVNMLPVIDVS
ncbi:MAG: site-specific integrase [Bacteroidetes bacterium]|nr:site-specific integrase [Bacteroidota bacterium]